MKLENLSEAEKEFVNTIGYLGQIYNKTFSEKELTVWYDILGSIPDEILVKSIKELIKTEKFMPVPATILEKCKTYKPLDRFEVLEYMRYKNYFKNADEYFKAQIWLSSGNIPEWFKKEIKKYHDMLLNGDKSFYEAQENPTNYVKVQEKTKKIGTRPLYIEAETFECANCHEVRLLDEIGSTEVCLQDGVCIYCQEQGYGLE